MSNADTVSCLLERHGQTFAAELNIHLDQNTPAPLFQWLCFSLLASARISHNAAVNAARALFDHGWTTVQKLADSTWRERVTVLNRSGYARYDESTSRMLGDTTQLLLDEYGGDLRKLRRRADRHADRERALLKEFKGIGDVGVDIFMRETQLIWDELYPFADKVALRAAQRLGLGKDAKALTRHVSKHDYPRLVAALIRTDLAGDYEEITAAA